MPHLVAYAQMSTTNNTLAGKLVKAQCDFCGKKFGSLEEARKCENKHIDRAIRDIVKKGSECECLQ